MKEGYRMGINNAVKTIIIATVLLIMGCKTADKPLETNDLFFDYKVTGNEGDLNLFVLLQYREGKNGDAIKPEGTVQLDGRTLMPDSTRIEGYFYETFYPIADFIGKHTIVFIDKDNKKYSADFEFSTFSISRIPDTVRRGDFVIDLKGLNDNEYVHTLLIDTSFENGITRTDTIRNGKIVITREQLESVANGPIQLEIARELEIPIKKVTAAGGMLRIVYSVKREFVLFEQAR